MWPISAVVDMRRERVWPISAVVDMRRVRVWPISAVVDMRRVRVWPISAVVDMRRVRVWPISAVVDMTTKRPNFLGYDFTNVLGPQTFLIPHVEQGQNGETSYFFQRMESIFVGQVSKWSPVWSKFYI